MIVFPLLFFIQIRNSYFPSGGIIYEDNEKRVHTFLNNGSFVIVPGTKVIVDYLIIGGGGAGGFAIGGGGGAGAVVRGYNYMIDTTQTVIIGAGGKALSAWGQAPSGFSSSFGHIVALGGGGGGCGQTNGRNGGNGGGGGGIGTKFGGSGGFSGGNGKGDLSNGHPVNGGGGGGAGSTSGGFYGVQTKGGQGGYGIYFYNGTNLTYAGGGGGGQSHGNNGDGSFRGGNGGSPGKSAPHNSGSGGGGGRGWCTDYDCKGGNGGSGIVFIVYKISNIVHTNYVSRKDYRISFISILITTIVPVF